MGGQDMKINRARALIVAGLVDMAVSKGARAAIMAHMPPNAAFPGGEEGFALKSTGARLNPDLLVRLNPLPDPPDAPPTVINLLTPTEPKLSLREGANFELAVTFRDFAGLMLPAFAPPDEAGDTEITFCVERRAFTVKLNVSCSSRVTGWSSLPPGMTQGGSTGALFGLADDAGVQVKINVFEDWQPLSLTGEPEPTTFALLETGLKLIAAAAARHAAAHRLAGAGLH